MNENPTFKEIAEKANKVKSDICSKCSSTKCNKLPCGDFICITCVTQ